MISSLQQNGAEKRLRIGAEKTDEYTVGGQHVPSITVEHEDVNFVELSNTLAAT